MNHICSLSISVAAVSELSLISSKSRLLLAISKSWHKPCSRCQRIICWIFLVRIWIWW